MLEGVLLQMLFTKDILEYQAPFSIKFSKSILQIILEGTEARSQ